MKRIYFHLLVLAATNILISGCTSTVRLNVLKPAQITLPQNYEKLAIVHRHRPTQENMLTSIVDGILSGGVGLLTDRDAGKMCISGLKETLLRTPRFTVVEPPGVDLKGTGTGVFPPLLAWGQVESICKANGADALIVLEIFDTKSLITWKTEERKVKDKEGIETTVIDQVATLRMMITSGWRIYDYERKMVVDEHRGENFLDFHGRGKTRDIALAALVTGRDAINRTSFHSGNVYGIRIAPQWITVSREFFTTGSPILRRAARMSHTGDWDGAAHLWEKMSTSPKRKVARRATYNMAISHEVRGNLDEAWRWANKSYVQYRVKKGRSYSQIIRWRIADQERLNQQMQ
jgi:hypothetical protein